jgi:WD40 repeat protein
VGSALEEEYLGNVDGFHNLSLHDDMVVFHRHGEPWVALDRRTGTVRAAPPAARLPRPPAWVLARELPDGSTTWGHCRVLDCDREGAVVVDILTNDDYMDERYTYLEVSAGGTTLFAGGYDIDTDGVVIRVDVETGTLVWRWSTSASVRDLFCTPDAAKLLVVTDEGVAVLDGATGDELLRSRLHAAFGMLDPSGTRLVTVTRHAVRVWSLDRLAGQTHIGIPGSQDGNADVLWSPDGRRVLTGTALCDGGDGRTVAVLDPMDSTSYIEGGPAANARVVGNETVLEFAALGGMQMWDTETGDRLTGDRHRSYGIGRDLLWLAPNAQSYLHAWARHGGISGQPAVLLRALDGTVVARLGDEEITAAAWSADSSQFATGHPDGTVRLWDAGGTPRATLPAAAEAAVAGLVFSVDGKVLIAGGDKPPLHFWDVDTGRLCGSCVPNRHDRGVDDFVPEAGEPRVGPAWLRDVQWLHGQFGFQARRHPYRTRMRSGFVWIEPDEPALPTYRVAADTPLAGDPTGRHWASRTTHVALEPAG